MKRASLKSIAAAAGVSKTTASFVLNGKGDQHKINAATQTRIRKEAQRQNYQPSFLAQTLSSGKTMTIGLLLPTIENSKANALLHYLTPPLQSQHYRLLPGMAQPPAVGEREIIDDFILRQADAIIAVHPLHEKEWASSLAVLQTPLLIISKDDIGATPGTLNYDYPYMINLLIQQHFQHHQKAVGFIGRARTPHPKLEAYLTCYIDRFDISSTYHYLLKEAEPVANALKALAQQNVNALVFESPELAGEALPHLQKNHHPEIDNRGYSCMGWNPELTFAQPKIQGVDFAPSKLAEQVCQMLTAALKNSTAANPLSNQTLYQLYP